jgi:hypothetical protein
VGLDQHQRPQYIHERSRSSPSTEHYSKVRTAQVGPQAALITALRLIWDKPRM